MIFSLLAAFDSASVIATERLALISSGIFISRIFFAFEESLGLNTLASARSSLS